MVKNKFLLIGICLAFLASGSTAFTQQVTIDLNTEYQTIRGFGGMNHTTWVRDLNADQREKAFSNDPGKIGLSILRMHIDPDPGRFADQLQTAKYANEQGAILFASPWDPPSTLLENVNDLNRVKYDMYDAYVDHLNGFYNYMAGNNVDLYAISVQNEPDWGEWTRWTSDEMLNFIKNNAQNINTRVLAPESFQFRRPYTDPILNDAVANANVDIIGGHIYGGGLFDYPLAREKGHDVWMTEHLTGSDSPADNTWALALDLGSEINACMEANFNAYVWWYIRRFYGLIADDGNITKKGYVMSQFSKFIRPGSVRIDDVVSNAAGIETSAFKTDSSLVIIVINKNSSSVNLDFSIQNGAIDSLIQFTTSAEKNMVNDGGKSVSGNTFSASVDAKSVTTFTTHAEKGAGFGNIPPVAQAGDDINVDDSDGTGNETIIFNGLLSTDADGEILNYSWSMNGTYLSGEATSELDLPIGDHVVVLTVTDNDGATSMDTLFISVNSIFSTELWFEAECGLLGSTWLIEEENNASNNYYITTPAGKESTGAASSEDADILKITFEVSEAAQYKVWGRVITPSPNDDSFWIRMDTGTWTMWNSIPSGSSWHWDDVHDQSNDNTVYYDLSEGAHELSICFREDGALLDKIFIANTGIIPEGEGALAETCDFNDEETSIFEDLAESFKVSPNPATDHLQISWLPGFDQVCIYAIDGKKILQRFCPDKSQVLNIDLDCDAGLYFIVLSNKFEKVSAKIIVK